MDILEFKNLLSKVFRHHDFFNETKKNLGQKDLLVIKRQSETFQVKLDSKAHHSQTCIIGIKSA